MKIVNTQEFDEIKRRKDWCSWISSPIGAARAKCWRRYSKKSRKYEGKLEIVKVNVDQSQDLAQSLRRDVDSDADRFGDGKAVKQSVGFQPKNMLENMIDGLL